MAGAAAGRCGERLGLGGLLAASAAPSCSVVSPAAARRLALRPHQLRRHIGRTRVRRPSGRATPGPAGSRRRAGTAPLAGKVVGIDPGHNGRNDTDPAFINHQIFNGRTMEACDTAGTQTASGYTEARFNFDVATYLAADLRSDGARIVLTRRNNHGLGPCVNKRSTDLNHHRRGDRYPRRRRPGLGPRVHRARTRRRRAERQRHRVIAAVRPVRAPGFPAPIPRSAPATTTGTTAICSATTLPG